MLALLPPAIPEFPAPVRAAADELRLCYGGVAAIVFYGSCLRDRTTDGLLDFYVLVDRYRDALSPLAALGARLLPPNVYLHTFDLRAKVAVMRLDDFCAGLGPTRFTSTLSARFAQPSAIVFARDAVVRERLTTGFLAAAETCITRTLPLMPPCFTASQLWRRVFIESFAAELRPEGLLRIEALVDADPAFYAALTGRVLGEPTDGVFRRALPARARAVQIWRLRRVVGKGLNALRLIKAAFTFRGGLDYAAWKIKRHSGVEIAVTDDDRKKPLRAGLRLFARSLQLGAIK